MANLRLGLLGPLQVMAADAPIASLESDKARALLTYLAVESAQPHRREALVGLLWPDCPEDIARRNLRQALYNLRRAIGDRAAKPPYLLITQDEIQFNTASDHSLDVSTFTALLDTCDDHLPRCIEACPVHAARLEEAMALYRGPFLQEFFLEDSAEFEEWAIRQREALHRRVLDSLTYLANYSELGGEYEAAHRWDLRLLELDPWREEAHRRVMRVLAASDQRSAALAQYEACRRVLSKELGVEPSAKTRDLYEQIKRGEPAVLKSEAPSVSTRTAPTLPVQTTPFIGRERELEELGGLLADPECRLLTLLGPGGIGKTRLALQAAANVREKFKQGAAFVSLGPVLAPAFIVTTLADAIGLVFSGAGDPKTQLLSYLREKEILIVLDNVEHLLADDPSGTDATGLFAQILEHAPRAKLVITSRELLNLLGEWVFEVGGLPVPEEEGDEAFEKSSAVALFLQRAHRAHVGFTLQAEERPAVVRICQLVGGMPLAIELAGAWARTLSPAEIEREIEHSLDFLETSMRDLPERHRSMRAVFDQSYRLLSERERSVLRRLSVFRGGFAREAANQVAGATLSLLSTLQSKSLLRRLPSGRYDLHELVRQYAAVQLHENPGEESDARDCHSHYYLTWMKEHEAALISSRQKEFIEQLTFEIDNLRQAWQWAIDQRLIELLRLAAWPLWYSYEVRGLFREGEAMFLQAVQSMLTWNIPNEIDNETRRATLGYLEIFTAYLALRQGRLEEAGQVLKYCLDPLKRTNDRVGLANAFLMYGVVCMFMGQFQEAIESLQEALVQALATSRQWELSLSRVLIGRVEYQLGDYNKSKRWITEGLVLGQKMGDPNLITFGISSLVETEHALGQLDEMESLLREGIQVAMENGSRFTYGMLQEQLAMALHSTGNTSEAQQLCQASVDLYRELGDEWSLSRALNLLGNFKLEEDEPTQALRFFLDALEVAFKAHSYAYALDALIGIAAMQAISQDDLLAFELTLHILQNPNSTHQAQNASNRLLKKLEARLTPEQIKAAKASAQAQSFDQIVEKVAHLATG